MPSKDSRRLVIDASVARSAGETANARAKACRELLVCVLTFRHRVVMTSAIVVEWDKHRSGYCSTWLVKMRNLRKLDRVDVPEDAGLRERLPTVSADRGVVKAMLKDFHLIEAALATDQIVISLDEKVRGHFSTAASVIDEITRILWANPVVKREKVIKWLENGAALEKNRLLGYQRR